METLRYRLAAAALALLSSTVFLAASAQPGALPEADQQCLACHGQAGLTKAFDKGGELALHVDPAAFAASVHAPLGCAACHSDVDVKKHPGSGRKFETARAFMVSGMQTCRGCHASIFDAYAASVHGRSDAGATPICADCHSAHAVARASVGTHVRDNCASCHANTLDTHSKWLPNTQRHLDSVACAACHAPGIERRVDLRLYSTVARREASGRETNGTNGSPLDGKGLQELLAAINRGTADKVTLIGRLEARTPEEAHGLARKENALRDCANCHRKGAEPFQNVTLSVVGPDGKRVRYEAKSDVLHGPASVDTMRGFYAPGGTRIQALDVLLALAVGGGVLAPLGHLVMRRVMRRKEGKQ